MHPKVVHAPTVVMNDVTIAHDESDPAYDQALAAKYDSALAMKPVTSPDTLSEASTVSASEAGDDAAATAGRQMSDSFRKEKASHFVAAQARQKQSRPCRVHPRSSIRQSVAVVSSSGAELGVSRSLNSVASDFTATCEGVTRLSSSTLKLLGLSHQDRVVPATSNQHMPPLTSFRDGLSNDDHLLTMAKRLNFAASRSSRCTPSRAAATTDNIESDQRRLELPLRLLEKPGRIEAGLRQSQQTDGPPYHSEDDEGDSDMSGSSDTVVSGQSAIDAAGTNNEASHSDTVMDSRCDSLGDLPSTVQNTDMTYGEEYGIVSSDSTDYLSTVSQTSEDNLHGDSSPLSGGHITPDDEFSVTEGHSLSTVGRQNVRVSPPLVVLCDIVRSGLAPVCGDGTCQLSPEIIGQISQCSRAWSDGSTPTDEGSEMVAFPTVPTSTAVDTEPTAVETHAKSGTGFSSPGMITVADRDAELTEGGSQADEGSEAELFSVFPTVTTTTTTACLSFNTESDVITIPSGSHSSAAAAMASDTSTKTVVSASSSAIELHSSSFASIDMCSSTSISVLSVSELSSSYTPQMSPDERSDMATTAVEASPHATVCDEEERHSENNCEFPSDVSQDYTEHTLLPSLSNTSFSASMHSDCMITGVEFSNSVDAEVLPGHVESYLSRQTENESACSKSYEDSVLIGSVPAGSDSDAIASGGTSLENETGTSSENSHAAVSLSMGSVVADSEHDAVHSAKISVESETGSGNSHEVSVLVASDGKSVKTETVPSKSREVSVTAADALQSDDTVAVVPGGISVESETETVSGTSQEVSASVPLSCKTELATYDTLLSTLASALPGCSTALSPIRDSDLTGADIQAPFHMSQTTAAFSTQPESQVGVKPSSSVSDLTVHSAIPLPPSSAAAQMTSSSSDGASSVMVIPPTVSLSLERGEMLSSVPLSAVFQSHSVTSSSLSRPPTELSTAVSKPLTCTLSSLRQLIASAKHARPFFVHVKSQKSDVAATPSCVSGRHTAPELTDGNSLAISKVACSASADIQPPVMSKIKRLLEGHDDPMAKRKCTDVSISSVPMPIDRRHGTTSPLLNVCGAPVTDEGGCRLARGPTTISRDVWSIPRPAFHRNHSVTLRDHHWLPGHTQPGDLQVTLQPIARHNYKQSTDSVATQHRRPDADPRMVASQPSVLSDRSNYSAALPPRSHQPSGTKSGTTQMGKTLFSIGDFNYQWFFKGGTWSRFRTRSLPARCFNQLFVLVSSIFSACSFVLTGHEK